MMMATHAHASNAFERLRGSVRGRCARTLTDGCFDALTCCVARSSGERTPRTTAVVTFGTARYVSQHGLSAVIRTIDRVLGAMIVEMKNPYSKNTAAAGLPWACGLLEQRLVSFG